MVTIRKTAYTNNKKLNAKKYQESKYFHFFFTEKTGMFAPVNTNLISIDREKVKNRIFTPI